MVPDCTWDYAILKRAKRSSSISAGPREGTDAVDRPGPTRGGPATVRRPVTEQPP